MEHHICWILNPNLQCGKDLIYGKDEAMKYKLQIKHAKKKISFLNKRERNYFHTFLSWYICDINK